MSDEDEDEHEHRARVEAWRARMGGAPAPGALVAAFERAFRAVWARANVTLGDVTLTAIGDRVLSEVGERYPILRVLRLETSGVSCEDLARDARSLDRPELLDEAVQFALVELLTVLGRLTGEVLTPMLHAALEADRFLDEDSAP
jgi:hypothetical protein